MTEIERIAKSQDPEALSYLLTEQPLGPLLEAAREARIESHGHLITYSPKVFLPLTQLCRDNCGYCVFARPPRPGTKPYMSEEEILNLARAAASVGVREALFTLGDRPEKRYRVAREQLSELGCQSTIEYLVRVAARVRDETGLIVHANPGVVSRAEMISLREVSASGGLMVEQISPRLLERGQAHWASPDKEPARRLETIALAGELNFPFTTGMLIGIGETILERAQTIGKLAQVAGGDHVQELIVQNFRAKPGTGMSAAVEPSLEDLQRAIAVTRLACPPGTNIQAPPNLIPPDGSGELSALVAAGINDWGGVSPLTMDYVNPEAPWPQVAVLEQATWAAGCHLEPRLAVYPEYIRDFDQAARWLSPPVLRTVLTAADSQGLARADPWCSGGTLPAPTLLFLSPPRPELQSALRQAELGQVLEEREIVTLFGAQGRELRSLTELADAVRREVNGDVVTYVVNRNINYTNICYFRCQFCAFSKGKMSENLRGKPELLSIGEVVEKARVAVERGATEICMQGGIHPSFTGDFYIELCGAVKEAVPEVHIHSFSPLEVFQGAQTAGRSVAAQLELLRAAGLGTLPGTAAEVLDDDVRRHLCPDKLSTSQWVDVVEEAHHQGLRTTSTIMFGSIESTASWTRHLLVLRDLQSRTGGITEFVPLPFVHMEAPNFRKGRARRGPTWEEVVKMHAVARLALRGFIDNIQVSWVKCGLQGAQTILQAGANDLGGTLMNESISRAAGAAHGQEVSSQLMQATIRGIGRTPAQRTTLYQIQQGFPVEAA
ncbi:MAG TPA: 5-amino-6-(D-ribitylamino)uracil--L-tyrosine 4-hydroxyphenyl transferase CofH [Candidatus Dormibacteraeota bacterium]|jgi:FO synthase|nr:5-amino-6-(D-ribitylamino)uracil--L-tyrosine 4-hydroxyphenyl transferase CofH [Candidatus Dormibacteraeota bacterium]